MRPMGVPRNKEAVDCDVAGAREYARKPSDFGLPGKSGDIRSNFKRPAEKRSARRYWKRVGRAAGKLECSVNT